MLCSLLYDASRPLLVDERREALASRGDDVHESLAPPASSPVRADVLVSASVQVIGSFPHSFVVFDPARCVVVRLTTFLTWARHLPARDAPFCAALDPN